LITLFLTCLLINLCEIAFPSLSDATHIALWVIASVGLVVWVVWELKFKNPLFDLRLFKIPAFAFGNIANAFLSFNTSTVMYSILFFFQGPYRQNPLFAGILMIPFGAGIMILGFVAGILYDKFGAKIMSVVGTLITCGGTIGCIYIQPGTNYGLIFLYLFLVGFGSGLFNSPNATSIMASVPIRQRGNASAVRTMLGALFRMICVAVTFAVIFGNLPIAAIEQVFLVGGGIDPEILDLFMTGYRKNLWIGFATSAVAFLVTIFLPNDFARPTKYVFYLSDPEGHEVVEDAKHADSEDSNGHEAGDEDKV